MPAFISHSFKDEAIYTPICLALDSEKVERWDPASMSAGESLAGQLRKAISVCEVCVCIATRRSIESSWCLAELGAFWGAGKRVLIYLADPDITDSMLPPQFSGNLRVSNANDLIRAIREAIDEQSSTGGSALELSESSAVFGPDSKWLSLVEESRARFYVMGVSLHAWVKMRDFGKVVRRKAEKDRVEFRFMTLHPDNPSIAELETSKRKDESATLVREQISITSQAFAELAIQIPQVQYRQLRLRTPNFALTLSDKAAVLVQYLHSLNWGSGPLLKCAPKSTFYPILEREFESLWIQADAPKPLTAAKGPNRSLKRPARKRAAA